MLNALPALAEVFKGNARPHVVEAQEFVDCPALLGLLERGQVVNGLFTRVVGVLEDGVVVEHVHGRDELPQGFQRL